MTEVTTQNEAYQRQQEEDYAVRAVALADELRVRMKSIVFGPTYKIATKNGKLLSMQTYQIPSGDTRRIDIIIALDALGHVVGHKIVMLDENEKSIEGTNGAIYVAKRGEGIAKPIEMVSFHLLQHEANAKQKDIRYIGVNRNAEHLQHVEDTIFREQQEKKPLTYDPATIPDLIEESQRWYSLFGPYGSLGFDALTRKVFSHNGSVDSIDQSSIIEISPEVAIVNERKITVPHVIAIQQDPAGQRADFEKQKLLKDHILPQLQAMAA